MRWTDPESPRIWRCTGSTLYTDELLDAPARHTDDVLARVADEGFTGVWFCCQLYDLMASAVWPELNRPRAGERVAALRTVIERGRKHGVGVYLYFNDPVGIDVDDPFWQRHPDLRGVTKWRQYSLCTSQPEVLTFLRDAVASVFARLHGVAGVFLITACEALTHCWSKSATRRGQPAPTCPRCRDREPADLVLEILQVWADVRRAQPDPFRLMAWNWEWAYWYEDPPARIAGRLPEGVELLLDMEIGATRPWNGRENYIGEYCLGYVGPSPRLVATHAAAPGVPAHAKIELNVTHEMCSVPNLPLIHNLHGKFRAMTDKGLAGFLGCWSMGTRLTLNTHALRLFLRDPVRFMDRDVFLDALAREYFGLAETGDAVAAWARFCEAFTHYPFSVQVLYFGPHNDAPARPLSLHYRGEPTGRSFKPDPMGDDLSRCCETAGCDTQNFTLDEIVDGFERMCEHWDAGLVPYAAALADPAHPRRADELRCARMIGIQLRSTWNAYRFFREQQRLIARDDLTPPCDLPPDDSLLAIMADEIANAERALPLVDADPRLGFHQDCGGYKYDPPLIRAKLATMRAGMPATDAWCD